jgi:hypothetical protein
MSKKIEIMIEFDNSHSRTNFNKWLKTKGFDLFMKSKENKASKTIDEITCLDSAEETEYGNYYHLQ